MTPRIEILTKKKLIGKRLTISYANYNVNELWKSFMPKLIDINNKLTNNLFSISVYNPKHFENFQLTNDFDKWAAVEVSDFEDIPEGLERFEMQDGLYAVFDYKGLSTDNSIFQFIYTNWLPNSVYTLDNRPHFEILGDKYKNNDPTSEEEIWIPIKI